MPPVVIDGTLSIRIVWLLAGAEFASNIVNANIGASPSVDQSMATTIAGHVGSAHGSSGLQPLQPADVTIGRVDIRDVRTANQPVISASVGTAGTSVNELLPRGNSLVVTLRTALAGRSYRGRTYVPGFARDAIDMTGRATTAATDAAGAFIDDLNTSMTSEGWPLGVGSLFENGTRRDTGVINNIINAVVRNSVWDRQWRRTT